VAVDRYKGDIDFVVGLDLVRAGSLVQSRITGAFEGIRERIANIPARNLCDSTVVG